VLLATDKDFVKNCIDIYEMIVTIDIFVIMINNTEKIAVNLPDAALW
jgi:hypothetical protein